MNQDPEELKLLSQELKNPYQQLNLVFVLIGIIPALSCAYILYGKLLLHETLPQELVPILFFANLIMLLGYLVGYRLVKNVLKKVLVYASRAKNSEEMHATMAVSLAHDLKSPLAVIKANMTNLKAGLLGPLAPKQEEMADLCTSVADRTAAILMGLIKTYTLHDGTSELTRSRFDLHELIEEQLREIAAVAQTKSIELKGILSKTALPLNADRAMIVRVINNLLSNAIKYTPLSGKVTVKASVREGFAQLDILNTGKLIPENMLERIFEGRERLDRSVEGEGLGLGIARAITEAHGGKIWVESAPGRPNCFTVLLPLFHPTHD